GHREHPGRRLSQGPDPQSERAAGSAGRGEGAEQSVSGLVLSGLAGVDVQARAGVRDRLHVRVRAGLMDRAEGQIALFGQTVPTLAAIAIVLGALPFGSLFVTRVLLALVLALIFWPVYTLLRRRGLAAWLALLALLIGLIVGFLLLVTLVAYSMSSMAT